jgi:hypothetical protein
MGREKTAYTLSSQRIKEPRGIGKGEKTERF